MTEQKTRETLKAEWWEAWWQKNYSWDNLDLHSLGDELGPRKKKGLFGETSLQDYWRRNPETGESRTDEKMLQSGELVQTPDGELWHRAHVPLKWLDGRPGKEAWDETQNQRLLDILSIRLTEAGQNSLEKIGLKSDLDGRAQLSGAVLPRGLSLSQMRSFGDGAMPVRVVSRHAWIENLFAAGQIFEDDADFSFSFITRAAIFPGAKFEGKAVFRSVFVGKILSFDGVHFRDDVMFKDASVLALGDFRRAHFLGDALFSGTSFSNHASFTEAIFLKTANFSSVNFEDFANFSNCDCRDEMIFSGSKFADKALFDKTKFDGQVTFHDAVFEGRARFSSTRFSQAGVFSAAKLRGGASFENIEAWGNGRNAWSGAFFGASASGVLSFENSVPPPFAAFDGLHLERDALLSFDDDGKKSLDTAFDHETALFAGPLKKDCDVDNGAGAPGYPSFLGKLAGGCRVFKNYFDSKGDRERAQRFFRLELQARMKSDKVGRLEKWVFVGYRMFSDYGASIGRPLLGLFWLSWVSVCFTGPLQRYGLDRQRYLTGSFLWALLIFRFARPSLSSWRT
jgi:uncharacterized protein YjbI with pentapeptide repeats